MSKFVSNKLFVSNRKKLAKLLGDRSILVLFAGSAPYKRGDQFYHFAPQRNFYYATGIDSQNVILMITKNGDKVSETLFLERFDELKAKWVGAVLSKEEAEDISGIASFRYIDEFEATMAQMLFSIEPTVYLDLENRSFNAPPSPDILFANRVKERYPSLEIRNARKLFAELRVIKSKDEIKCIQKAIDITNDAIVEMMKNARPGMAEYEIEAYFDYVLKKNGVNRAFNSIAASGKNATVLHYENNNQTAKDGDLILFDVGAEYGCYSADITRTFPVNGKFTERQKLFYNIVLEGQQRVIDIIKPDVPFKELNQTLTAFYAKELKKAGLIQDKDEVSKYYYHGVSHMLGLETHDIFSTKSASVTRNGEAVLKKGMVLTVEPGLYIEEEGIGIRIEDDVAVTSSGCNVLSKDIIRTVPEIEALMSN